MFSDSLFQHREAPARYELAGGLAKHKKGTKTISYTLWQQRLTEPIAAGTPVLGAAKIRSGFTQWQRPLSWHSRGRAQWHLRASSTFCVPTALLTRGSHATWSHLMSRITSRSKKKPTHDNEGLGHQGELKGLVREYVWLGMPRIHW